MKILYTDVWTGSSDLGEAGGGGESRLTATMLTDKLFTGQRDTGLGIYYYNARFYSQKLGRFISADTIGVSYANPQTLNRYSYVLNDPIRYTDPTGHSSCAGEGHYDDGPECAKREGSQLNIEIKILEYQNSFYKTGHQKHNPGDDALPPTATYTTTPSATLVIPTQTNTGTPIAWNSPTPGTPAATPTYVPTSQTMPPTLTSTATADPYDPLKDAFRTCLDTGDCRDQIIELANDLIKRGALHSGESEPSNPLSGWMPPYDGGNYTDQYGHRR